jgi:hypothetical protein
LIPKVQIGVKKLDTPEEKVIPYRVSGARRAR